MTASRLVRAAPYLFIFVWSSGYVVAKYGLPYVQPLTFLCLRYVGVIAMMGVLTLWSHAPWPSSPRQAFHIAAAGILIQAGYLGGVWCAIKLGMPAGLAALIVNTQPILTAVLSRAVGERVNQRQWLGLILGLVGVTLVLWNKISGAGLSWASVALTIFALLSMTFGVLYQKRYCPHFDVRTGQVLQFVASLAVTAPCAILFEDHTIVWAPEFFAALGWSVFVLSGIGISLLFMMIRHGAATKVTGYLYLVPPVTAIMAWLMFGERLEGLALCGMAVTVFGVALVVRRGTTPAVRG